jgi:putative ABC transport system substrate-binding protein
VDKILKGGKPADLPIQQATRFQLLLNVKTAKALTFTVPPEVLSRVDRLIGG